MGGLELGSDASVVRWPNRYADKRGEVMRETATVSSTGLASTLGSVRLPPERGQ